MTTAVTGGTFMPRLGRLARGLVVAMVAMVGCGDGGSAASHANPSTTTASKSTTSKASLAQAKFLIEHNATDDDTGYQLFVDGEPWNRLTVEGPGGGVIEVNALGNMFGFGLTEGFFETNEPPGAVVPLEDVLSLFPEGRYEFEAVSVDGTILRRTATLTHTIPAEPEILSPAEGAVVDPHNLVVDWNPVEESLTSGRLTIEGYQVIISKDVVLKPSESFFKSEMSVFLPASTTILTVPSEFLEPRTAYEIEVLAIESSGNQTIALRAFETQ